MISLIVAMGNGGVIGKNNQMPWHMPADLAYFKRITFGHPVVMGRKTFESIGKALPGRKNIIVSHQTDFSAEDCIIVHSVEEVRAMFQSTDEEVFICGGSAIYHEFFPYAERLYITSIHHDFDGDTFFPKVAPEEWSLVSKEKGEMNEKNPYEYFFLVYQRK